ncbi:MAG: hypothetical protein EZS28_011733 [Streblomastix strix]|uniref:Transmembrane protein n=1 Tax=Streblomastix strix TaxID=222440 RepID=A0A5J4WCS3_9EUKA|nr:MAG: hypothetical protein EZS28_011733 [Streblomastix strix]
MVEESTKKALGYTGTVISAILCTFAIWFFIDSLAVYGSGVYALNTLKSDSDESDGSKKLGKIILFITLTFMILCVIGSVVLLIVYYTGKGQGVDDMGAGIECLLTNIFLFAAFALFRASRPVFKFEN